MDNRENHITNSEDYQKYLDGSMTPKERHDFEKRLLNDEFESEALEGFGEINPAYISKDISLLRDKLNSNTKKSSAIIYWRVAAAVLVLVASSFAVYFLIDVNTTQELAQSKEKTEEEKALIPHEKVEVLEDSIIEEPERIIAYQQEADKTTEEKPATAPAKIKSAPIEEELESVENELALEVVTDSFEEVPEKAEVQAAEPAELPTLAYEDAPVEIDPQDRKKSIVARESVPPTAMAKSQYSTRIDNLRTVTGKIVSVEDDEAIPGVNVVVKGSGEGTVSDIEGNYKIEVPEDEDVTLVYSYIGFSSEEIDVRDQENIDVNIEPDVSALSEIVVVGYGVAAEDEEKSYSYFAPQPEGGNGKFKDYVKENIRYPASGIEEQTKGTVKLEFTVGTQGELLNMEVLKSLGEDFDKEAVRLVMEGPKWESAKENDEPVVRDVKVKIRFRPPE